MRLFRMVSRSLIIKIIIQYFERYIMYGVYLWYKTFQLVLSHIVQYCGHGDLNLENFLVTSLFCYFQERDVLGTEIS